MSTEARTVDDLDQAALDAYSDAAQNLVQRMLAHLERDDPEVTAALAATLRAGSHLVLESSICPSGESALALLVCAPTGQRAQLVKLQMAVRH